MRIRCTVRLLPGEPPFEFSDLQVQWMVAGPERRPVPNRGPGGQALGIVFEQEVKSEFVRAWQLSVGGQGPSDQVRMLFDRLSYSKCEL